MPVIQATWEDEAGESLELGRWRLWWIEIVPLHSSLGNRSKTSSKKKTKKLFCQTWWLTPSTLGGWSGWITRSGVQDHPGQHDKTPSLLKKKISRAWWCVPVIPATRKAKAGELLELWGWMLQWAEIAPLHSILVTEWDSISKKKKREWWPLFIIQLKRQKIGISSLHVTTKDKNTKTKEKIKKTEYHFIFLVCIFTKSED